MSEAIIERMMEDARAKRQAYEGLVRLADSRGRPADYANAMQAAISYVAVVDGILAKLIRADA